MGKLTIIFIAISAYIIVTNSSIFNGTCKPIVNEHDCVEKSFFEKLTKPKSYQVIAHMELEKNHGVTMFYTYLRSNLMATITYDSEITFTINCFKIPFEIKHQDFMNFKLKTRGCNNIFAMFKQFHNKKYDFYSYTNKNPILITIFKIDNYLSIWGCISCGNSSVDQAAWILMDDENNIEYDRKMLKHYLDDFLEKMKPKINQTILNLTNNMFRVYKVSEDYNACYNISDENKVFNEIKKNFPLNTTLMSLISIDGTTKKRFAVVLMMFLGHIIFMIGFFAVGYLIVVWCCKE